MKKVIVIGGGFSSLSAANYLAQKGYEVNIFEKNNTIGGRARQFKKEGFTFDMGPTWYWMPDVFERFFADFGKTPEDFYTLQKLLPAYKIFFGKNEVITIEDSLEKIYTTFENEEKGSAKKLKKFINTAQENYAIAIKDLVYRPGISPLELVNLKTITKLNRFFSTISNEIRKSFKSSKLIQILEFPVLFLGAKPSNTPAFYSFMNYADFGLGTWHPTGGMYQVVTALEKLTQLQGINVYTNTPVDKILIENGKAFGVTVNQQPHYADIVVSGADYQHSEHLLPKKYRQYSESYWHKKTFAPSALLFYVGFDIPLKNTAHHTLFFDVDFEAHATSIYDIPSWPESPLFYASFPSKTDKTLAPEGKETGIFLIPLAPGIQDSKTQRKRYFDKIMIRLEKLTQQSIKRHFIFAESFCKTDFVEAYNSFKGNAYGLANTLQQTAFLRPKLKSKKVKSLYFTGQLTVPGPGVPPALISGKLVADLIEKHERL